MHPFWVHFWPTFGTPLVHVLSGVIRWRTVRRIFPLYIRGSGHGWVPRATPPLGGQDRGPNRGLNPGALQVTMTMFSGKMAIFT